MRKKELLNSLYEKYANATEENKSVVEEEIKNSINSTKNKLPISLVNLASFEESAPIDAMDLKIKVEYLIFLLIYF